ncbi:hypothetical protein TD3509T_530001 [Tenacibaculum dicentrarchi]|uniref:Lipoprotein n=1 Tax=Tenacibaculum dicentrarchi TaxID=669041 RepID=A0ABM9NXP8_9FLAO|nr:hypothetical protein TD3509T_530001 [Tenacibaculum dicentrarchi]
MKKLLLIIVVTILSCKSEIKSQTSDEKETKKNEIKVDTDKLDLTNKLEKYFLQDGLDKRNSFLNNVLTKIDKETNKKEKNALNYNNRYGNTVESEKKIIKAKKERENFLLLKKEMNKFFESKDSKKILVYDLQKSPKGVVEYLFSSFQKARFSEWKYFMDPYLIKFDEENKLFMIFSYLPKSTNYKLNNSNNYNSYRNTKSLNEKYKEFKALTEKININVKNVRIEKNKAFVLTSIISKESEQKKQEEIVIELVNRNEYWFITGIRE